MSAIHGFCKPMKRIIKNNEKNKIKQNKVDELADNNKKNLTKKLN
jgi:hypothetical protein